MELHVKDGRIPQLMIDKTELKHARFLSKMADSDGKTLFVFAVPACEKVEKPKRKTKKKEVEDESIGAVDEGKAVNESE